MEVRNFCSWIDPAKGETRRRLPVLQAGAFFGEIAPGTDEPRTATIEALVDTKLLADVRDRLHRIADDRLSNNLVGFDASNLEML